MELRSFSQIYGEKNAIYNEIYYLLSSPLALRYIEIPLYVEYFCDTQLHRKLAACRAKQNLISLTRKLSKFESFHEKIEKPVSTEPFNAFNQASREREPGIRDEKVAT